MSICASTLTLYGVVSPRRVCCERTVTVQEHSVSYMVLRAVIWCLYAVLFLICFFPFQRFSQSRGTPKAVLATCPSCMMDSGSTVVLALVGRTDIFGAPPPTTTARTNAGAFVPSRVSQSFPPLLFYLSLSSNPKNLPFLIFLIYVPTYPVLKTEAPFTRAVLPCKVPEEFLHGVMCEWDQGSIFWEICTGNLPAQDQIIFPEHCLYSCALYERSDEMKAVCAPERHIKDYVLLMNK